MKTTYDFIDSNGRKTIFLIILFPLSLAAVIYASLFVSAYFYVNNHSSANVPASAIFNLINFYFVYILAGVLAVSVLWTVAVYFAGHNFILSSLNTNKADPDKHREIIRIVENTAITAGLPMPKVYILSDSALNAFATGRNPENACVALTTGLIEKLDKAELEGVIAHEMSHIGNRDTRLMLIIILVTGFFTLAGGLLMRVTLRSRGGRNRAALIFAAAGLVLYLYGTLIAPLIRLALSRRREYQADATAALITRNPRGLISALKKIKTNPRVASFQKKESMGSMCIADPLREKVNLFDSIAGLLSTHPPVEDRIKALEEMDNYGPAV